MGRFRRLHGQRGSAIIEMSVALPVLILMVFGIARFGIAFNNFIVLTDATRVGARSLAISRGSADPCTTARTKLLNAATSLNSANVTITSHVNNTNYSGACAGQGTTMAAGDEARLTATYPCSVVIFGINFIPSCTMTAQTSVRVE